MVNNNQYKKIVIKGFWKMKEVKTFYDALPRIKQYSWKYWQIKEIWYRGDYLDHLRIHWWSCSWWRLDGGRVRAFYLPLSFISKTIFIFGDVKHLVLWNIICQVWAVHCIMKVKRVFKIYFVTGAKNPTLVSCSANCTGAL